MRLAIDLSAIQPDMLYAQDDAARFRGKSPKTLANERCERRGPPVTYIGNVPYYRGSDLLKDIERGRVDYRQHVALPKRRRAAA